MRPNTDKFPAFLSDEEFASGFQEKKYLVGLLSVCTTEIAHVVYITTFDVPGVDKNVQTSLNASAWRDVSDFVNTLNISQLQAAAGQSFEAAASVKFTGKIAIKSRRDRNRCIHGDIVAVELLQPAAWHLEPDAYDPNHVKGTVIPAGKVIYVVSNSGSQQSFLCSLKTNVSCCDKYVRAVPLQSKIPWMLISRSQFEGFLESSRRAQKEWTSQVSKRGFVGAFFEQGGNQANPLEENQPHHNAEDEQCSSKDDNAKHSKEEASLFRCRIKVWHPNSVLPQGQILEFAGFLGDWLTEERASMDEHGLSHFLDPFPAEVEAEVSRIISDIQSNFSSEKNKRTVFSKSRRVITIDPASARDLDDAIHVYPVSTDIYEVGVHIADVSHFVRPNTLTDQFARTRTTTVYLPFRNFPMLPRLLCDELCSLHPGDEKLTLSVIFFMRGDGSVILPETDPDNYFRPEFPYRVRYEKSVIKPVCRFSYEEVDKVLSAFRQALAQGVHDLDDVMNNVPHPPVFAVEAASPWHVDTTNDTWGDIWRDLVLLESLTQNTLEKRLSSGGMRLSAARFGEEFGKTFMLTLFSHRSDYDEGNGVAVASKKKVDTALVPSVDDRLVTQCSVEPFDEDTDLTEAGPAEDTSHSIIEELMLLANKLVAWRLMNDDLTPSLEIRKNTVLRYHPRPKMDGLKYLEDSFTFGTGASSAAKSGAKYLHEFLQNILRVHGRGAFEVACFIILLSQERANYATAEMQWLAVTGGYPWEVDASPAPDPASKTNEVSSSIRMLRHELDAAEFHNREAGSVNPVKPAKVDRLESYDTWLETVGSDIAQGISAEASNLDAPWAHFALAFPLYSHFTSPIRRYADLLTHRLLSYCISHDLARMSENSIRADLCQNGFTHDSCKDVLDRANSLRIEAKNASEECMKRFWGLYLREKALCSAAPSFERKIALFLRQSSKSLNMLLPMSRMKENIYLDCVCGTKNNNGADKEADVLKVLPKRIKSSIAIPKEILTENNLVTIKWAVPKRTSLKFASDTVSMVFGLGSSVPIYVVPLESFPTSIAIFCIPPWEEAFTLSANETSWLTAKERAGLVQAGEKCRRGVNFIKLHSFNR